MKYKKYDSLVIELTSVILKHNTLEAVKIDAELDLKWRLTQLYEEVFEEDEQKFIDIAGMQGHLMTSAQKREIEKKEKEVELTQENKQHGLSDLTEISKKTTDKTWAKTLYRRAVRRCHPDTIRVADEEYKEELTEIYKSLTESYESSNLDILMIESYKLFIKPKEVISDQIQILKKSKQEYDKKINDILASQGYVWSTFSDKMKVSFLVNLMKQQGVRFVDKQKIKEVIKRKVVKRKMGQKPKNNLRNRVKNKK